MNEYGELERKKDFDFFVENYQALYKTYGHKVIAIRFGEILGTYDSEAEAIAETTKKYPLGTFIVQECNGNESGYTNYISSWQIVSI